MASGYKNLDVWQLSIQLVEDVYKICDNFPKKEQYRLADQLCRAAISVPSNIAEGSKRNTTKEFVRFLSISQGSFAEVETQLIIAYRLKYMVQSEFDMLTTKIQIIGKKIHALSNSLEKRSVPQ